MTQSKASARRLDGGVRPLANDRRLTRPVSWLFIVLALMLGACGNDYGAPLNEKLSRALAPEWASLLSANRISQVRFNGQELVVEHGFDDTLSRAVHEREIPYYQSDPMEFVVRVTDSGGSDVDLKVYADLSGNRYRVRRVQRDVNALLHEAMSLYLREIDVLD